MEDMSKPDVVTVVCLMTSVLIIIYNCHLHLLRSPFTLHQERSCINFSRLFTKQYYLKFKLKKNMSQTEIELASAKVHVKRGRSLVVQYVATRCAQTTAIPVSLSRVRSTSRVKSSSSHLSSCKSLSVQELTVKVVELVDLCNQLRSDNLQIKKRLCSVEAELNALFDGRQLRKEEPIVAKNGPAKPKNESAKIMEVLKRRS